MLENNKILNLREKYQNGKLEKHQYITEMYQFHKILLEYVRIVQKTDIRDIVINKHGMFITTDTGLVLKAYEAERAIPFEMLNFGNYEKSEWNNIINILNKCKPRTILDIGGNIGYIAMMLKKNFPESLVYSFEPIKNTYEVFLEHIRMNKIDVIAENIGLSDEKGEFEYYYSPDAPGNASLKDLSHRDTTQKIRANVTTLDNYVEEKQIKNVDFIKLDVEGAEFSALKGAENVLEKYAPIIFAELLRKWSAPFGYKPQDVVEWLGEREYDCFTFKESGLKKLNVIDENTVETNFLFMKTKQSEKYIYV